MNKEFCVLLFVPPPGGVTPFRSGLLLTRVPALLGSQVQWWTKNEPDADTCKLGIPLVQQRLFD
jgi:hypothetical protein